MASNYDLIVIGGGSGGLATAQRAAEYGARVVLFEPARLGGTCVNVGCVPKKVMWYAAEVASNLAAASAYGFQIEARGHDFAVLKRARDAYIERLNAIYAGNLEKKAIRHVPSVATITGSGQVSDDAGNLFQAPHIVIATGGTPRHSTIEGAATGIDSDGFFDMETLPERVAIIGGGYVSVELAGVLHALGSHVEILQRGERILSSFDTMLSDELMAAMTASGIEVVTGAEPARITSDDKITVATRQGQLLEGYDQLIWAIGRLPNTAGLGLENTGVELDQRGYIGVDEYQNTAEPGIYAIGDVTGQAELTPVAIAAGRRLADRVFDGQADRKLRYDIIPTVVFSHPPIGTIGLSEADARARFGDEVGVYTSRFTGMFNAITEAKPKTAMKLVVAGADERIVGCHIIGPGADEMTQGFGVAISMGACKRDFDDTIAIHPTSGEELVTMR